MALFILGIILIHQVVVQGRTEVENLPSPSNSHFSVYENATGRARYNPWTCNYRSEPGYKCISCTAALHCYPTDFALLVQCAGLFPFCRNGYCSRFKIDDCVEDYMFAEGTHGPLRVTTSSNDNNTLLIEDNLASESPAQVPDGSGSTTVPTIESNDSNKVGEIVTPTDTANVVETGAKPNIEQDPRRWF